ncbi:MAG: PTS sugar transporter subunit IIA [Planctomycetota bacterium]
MKVKLSPTGLPEWSVTCQDVCFLCFTFRSHVVEDLDLAQLAQYLHVTPAQVEKMAVRGRVPGRRVGGTWRFNQAEIHHWLEAQIGATDDSVELDRVRKVVDRMTDDVQERSITELCSVETIEIPLRARTRSSVIRSMCDLVATSGMMWDAPAMAEAVRSREQMHPTALDCGVALMHPRRPQTSILADNVLGLAVSQAPIPFSDAGHMVDVFFLICSYDDASHLRTLAKLSRLIAVESLLQRLRECESPGQAWACLHEAEALLSA